MTDNKDLDLMNRLLAESGINGIASLTETVDPEQAAVNEVALMLPKEESPDPIPDLFGDATITGKQVPVDLLDVDKDHIWGIHEESDEYKSLYESISTHGIQDPLKVVPLDNGRYRIITGRRRLHIAKEIGFYTVPCIFVRAENEYQILVMRNSSNLENRRDILPSEKARALKAQMDALQKPGMRLNAGKEVAEKNGISKKEAYRYISLTSMIPEMQKMVDNGTISLRTASDYASRLSKENQKRVVAECKGEKNIAQARIVHVLQIQDQAAKDGRDNTDEEVRAALKTIEKAKPKPDITPKPGTTPDDPLTIRIEPSDDKGIFLSDIMLETVIPVFITKEQDRKDYMIKCAKTIQLIKDDMLYDELPKDLSLEDQLHLLHEALMWYKNRGF